MKKTKKKKKFSYSKTIPFLLIIASLFMSIGYASISSITSEISGTASATSPKNVFISDVESTTNVDADIDNSSVISYVKTVMTGKVVLSNTNQNSSITYKVTIHNNSKNIYTFKKVIYDTSFYDNENITYSLDGLTEEVTTIAPSEDLSFYITFSYLNNTLSDNNVLNYTINFKFSYGTVMKEALIDKFADGDEDNLTDVNSLSEEDRKSMFSSITEDGESSLIKTTGINGDDVFVFRGDVTNNYVYYAGYLWRIMQIDEDGNLRLIMESYIKDDAYQYQTTDTVSSLDEANSLLSYSNSNIKTVLDNWYNKNLSSYDKIVTSKFCEDLSYEEISSSGTDYLVYYYAPYIHIGKDADNYSPNLECSGTIIENNIGIISAEEYALAGGNMSKWNWSFYLQNSSLNSNEFWTMSASYYDPKKPNVSIMSTESGFQVLVDYPTGETNVTTFLTKKKYLRPIITINGNYEMKGSGTKKDPYMYSDSDEDIVILAENASLTSISEWNVIYIANSSNTAFLTLNATTDKETQGLQADNTVTIDEKNDLVVGNSNTNLTPLTFYKSGSYSQELYKTWTHDELNINTDKTITISSEAGVVITFLDNGYATISNEDASVYLSYDSENNYFVGKDTLDESCYLNIYNAKI